MILRSLPIGIALIACLAAATPAAAQSQLLDLDTSTGEAVLDSYDDGGFVVHGELTTGVIPATGTGTRMMWYPAKAALRAGTVAGGTADQWDDANIGLHSVAFGEDVEARGAYSIATGYASVAYAHGGVAIGYADTASGSNSVAIGNNARAEGGGVALGHDAYAGGFTAVAIGDRAVASQSQGVAIGRNTLASGFSAVAIGDDVEATDDNAVALGFRVSANTRGSFVFGDLSTLGNQMILSGPNQFAARASGGYRLFTNSDATTGVTVAAGGSSWASLSDVNRKENFIDLDGAYVLDAIASIPIREWNYIAQDDAVRHVGPSAQDFHAAFGLGSDPLRIETIDADGIAFVAIQALAQENEALRAENEELRERALRVEAETRALTRRLDRLEKRLDAVDVTGAHRASP